jgi:eukaryotic-like serine/threonine-protein kinase
MALGPGDRLETYEIVAPLGAGGMGQVWLATDLRLQRQVAIKVLPADLTQDASRVARFQQEARAASALNHPNVCTIHALGETTDDRQYIAMELVEGTTLRARLAGKRLPIRESLEIAIQIASALTAAHAAGIVHRDIKPENVMVRPDGVVKVLDFGLAKLTPTSGAAAAVESARTLVQTSIGVVMGTVAYMSPEQARGQEVDARTDIWSLGVVLYEMLSWRTPFPGPTGSDVLAAVLERDPAPLTAATGHVPPELRRIVTKALRKDREQRYQTTKDLLLDLQAVRDEPPPVTSSTGMAAASARTSARERVAWALAAAASLTCAIMVWPMFRSDRSDTNAQVVRFSVAPPERTVFATTETAAETPQLAVSPDGRYLVFAAGERTARTRLWLRALDSPALQPLPGTEDASFPFWSPDSRYIGFFTPGRLKKVAVGGNSAQTLCNVPSGRGGTWNRNGTILFAANIGGGLYRVSDAGGEPVAVTTLDPAGEENSHRWPQFLPDERHFLFVVRAAREHAGVYVGSLESPETRHLLSGAFSFASAVGQRVFFVKDGGLLAQSFDPDRLQLLGEPSVVAQQVASGSPSGFAAYSVSERVVAFSSGGTASRQLTWFDRAGRMVGTLGAAGEYMGPALSPDGRYVAVGQIDAQMRTPDVWLFDLTRGNSTRFTSSPFGERMPLWSPDGTRVLFSATAQGPWDLFVKPASGGAQAALLASSTDKFCSDWSPDGRFVTFHVPVPRTRWDIWLLPTFGDRRPLPYLHTEFDEMQGRLSPNGRWMAYTSNVSGALEVYVETIPASNGKWQISTAGGMDPHWRRDGKELFYIAADQMLMAVPVKTERTFEAGIPVPLFPTRVSAGVVPYPATYDVSADGQRFLMNAIVEDAPVSPIAVVVNWTADLKR